MRYTQWDQATNLRPPLSAILTYIIIWPVGARKLYIEHLGLFLKMLWILRGDNLIRNSSYMYNTAFTEKKETHLEILVNARNVSWLWEIADDEWCGWCSRCCCCVFIVEDRQISIESFLFFINKYHRKCLFTHDELEIKIYVYI